MLYNQRLSVLIADDDADIREVLKEYLEGMGIFHHIIEAKNGLEATAKIHNQDFNLYIVDLDMPIKSGLELIDSIRQKDSKTPHEIIIFSGSMESESVRGAIVLGVKHILAKPTSEEDFCNKVRTILKKELKLIK